MYVYKAQCMCVCDKKFRLRRIARALNCFKRPWFCLIKIRLVLKSCVRFDYNLTFNDSTGPFTSNVFGCPVDTFSKLFFVWIAI